MCYFSLGASPESLFKINFLTRTTLTYMLNTHHSLHSYFYLIFQRTQANTHTYTPKSRSVARTSEMLALRWETWKNRLSHHHHQNFIMLAMYVRLMGYMQSGKSRTQNSRQQIEWQPYKIIK